MKAFYVACLLLWWAGVVPAAGQPGDMPQSARRPGFLLTTMAQGSRFEAACSALRGFPFALIQSNIMSTILCETSNEAASTPSPLALDAEDRRILVVDDEECIRTLFLTYTRPALHDLQEWPSGRRIRLSGTTSIESLSSCFQSLIVEAL